MQQNTSGLPPAMDIRDVARLAGAELHERACSATLDKRTVRETPSGVGFSCYFWGGYVGWARTPTSAALFLTTGRHPRRFERNPLPCSSKRSPTLRMFLSPFAGGPGGHRKYRT